MSIFAITVNHSSLYSILIWKSRWSKGRFFLHQFLYRIITLTFVCTSQASVGWQLGALLRSLLRPVPGEPDHLPLLHSGHTGRVPHLPAPILQGWALDPCLLLQGPGITLALFVPCLVSGVWTTFFVPKTRAIDGVAKNFNEAIDSARKCQKVLYSMFLFIFPATLCSRGQKH